eukprot:2473990-Pyramimonas_sp.AAC.1
MEPLGIKPLAAHRGELGRRGAPLNCRILRSERLAAEVPVAATVCEDEPSAPLPAAASDRAPDPKDPADP